MADVTLVITSYNHGRFLAEAIESGLNQTEPFREIVVIDDGSTDDTSVVAARYPSVHYVRQENRGLSAARNSGLRRAEGVFVVFLDADDRLHAGAVDAGFRCLQANPTASFVYGRYRYIDTNGEPLPPQPLRPCGPDPYLDFLRDNQVAMHATVLYRREPILAAGGFDETLRACEDYDLYLRLSREGRVACHETVVADYRRHAANMSGDPRLMLNVSLAVLERQWPHVQGDGALLAAYHAGRQAWQTLYGTKLAGRILRGLRSGAPRGEIADDICLLFRRAPYALVANWRLVYKTVLRRLLSWLPFRLGGRLLAWLGPSGYVPPRGQVNFGDLRRLEPLSRHFGFDRGTPVDRYYIERFLEERSGDVRGRVLEVGDDTYTRRFGGDRVGRADVLNVYPAGGSTTIVSDLVTGTGIPDASFDCLIVTQTLHLLWDMAAGIRTLHRALKPGGVLLLTVPGTISQLESGQWRSTWYWGLGPLAVERLVGDVFPPASVQLGCHGNVLAGIAFLQGIAAEELRPAELDHRDPLYPVLITVRAVKLLEEPLA